ncbi:MAG: hypothetical protein HY892_07585 [Deltaproteobacteria bacterium]|nr:hypothetical protein [Deltaproteobacteria bacterium]
MALTVFFTVLVGLSALSYGAVGTRAATGLTLPAGLVQVQNNLWISDHVSGLCRLDPGAGGALVVNRDFCAPGLIEAGQAAFDGTFVYVADGRTGVVRLTFDAGANSLINPVTILSDPVNRAVGCALGPDGLYVSYIRKGSFDRILTPGGAPTVQLDVGAESAGISILQMAFQGNNLFLAGSAAVERITNAPASCSTAVPCTGALVTGARNVGIPMSLAFDGVNNLLYIGRASGVFRFDPITPGAVAELYVNGGTVPPNPTVLPFLNVSALGLDTGSANLFVTDDPRAGEPPVQGRLWRVPTNQLPGIAFIAPGVGRQEATGLTLPAGLIFLPGALGGHFWISDHLQGFCRLDRDPLPPGNLIINVDTCQGGLQSIVSPGQPSFDPANNKVYLPDSAADVNPLFRLNYDRNSETILPGLTTVATGLLNAADRMIASALGPDGHLYVGFIRTGMIQRVTTPNGPTQTVVNVGTDPGGGVNQLAFVGGDIYSAGLTTLNQISNAAICNGACIGTPRGKTITAPTALAFDGKRFIYATDIDSVWRLDITLPLTSFPAAEMFSNTALIDVNRVLYQSPTALAFGPLGLLHVADSPTENNLDARLFVILPHLNFLPATFKGAVR